MSTLKVGSKVQLLMDAYGFTKGQVVEVYRLCEDGEHLFKGDNTLFNPCDGQGGAFLAPEHYRVLDSTPAHPHADLILKYAMIAQYDDKPWEQFEFSVKGDNWSQCTHETAFYPHLMFRLKPQPPVVQVRQTWVSPEGITVQVLAVLSGSSTVMFQYPVGGFNQVQCMNTNMFSKVFKRKE